MWIEYYEYKKGRISMFIIKKRMICSIVAVMLVLPLLLSGCTAQNQSDTQTPKEVSETEKRVITLGQSGSLCQAALLMAYEKGFLEQEGFEVNLLKGDYPTLRDGLASGKVDVTDGFLMSWLKPVEAGLDLVFTTGVHTGCLAAVVLNDSDYKGFSDLKGKTIGVSGGIGGVPMNFAYRALYKEGLDNADYEWRDYPAPQLLAALEKGEIQAAVTTEHVSFAWIDSGKARLIRSSTYDDDFKDEYCCLLTFRGELARNEPEVVEAVTRAVMKATEWVANNKEETVDILVEKGYVMGTKEYNLKLLHGYDYLADVDGARTRESLEIAIKEMKATGILDEATDESKLLERIFFD